MQPVEANVNAVSAEAVRDGRTEMFYYLTLFVTAVEAGFIVWDMVALLPGAGRVFGFSGENTVYAGGTLSTMYLALLGIYAGVKEFTRWTSGGTAAQVPEAKAKQFRRGETIVGFWVLLLVVAASLEQLRLIARLPHELLRVTMQALAVITGTYASRGLLGRKRVREAQDTGMKELYGQKVLACIDANGYVNNELCKQATGLGGFQVYRLLKRLEREGLIEGKGTKRGRKYYKPGADARA